jgi:hypothetical protein
MKNGFYAAMHLIVNVFDLTTKKHLKKGVNYL